MDEARPERVVFTALSLVEKGSGYRHDLCLLAFLSAHVELDVQRSKMEYTPGTFFLDKSLECNEPQTWSMVGFRGLPA